LLHEDLPFLFRVICRVLVARDDARKNISAVVLPKHRDCLREIERFPPAGIHSYRSSAITRRDATRRASRLHRARMHGSERTAFAIFDSRVA